MVYKYRFRSLLYSICVRWTGSGTDPSREGERISVHVFECVCVYVCVCVCVGPHVGKLSSKPKSQSVLKIGNNLRTP